MRESQFAGPNTNFPEFQKASLRAASSGLETNYNALGNDFEGVSFSSLRQAVLEDRDHWKLRQRWMIEDVCEVIFARWLESALLSNQLNGLKPWELERLCQPDFQGRRWQWVDPLKDEQAATESFSNFTGDPLKVLREKGTDLDTVATNYETWLDRMEPIMERVNKVKSSLKAAPPSANIETEEVAD